MKLHTFDIFSENILVYHFLLIGRVIWKIGKKLPTLYLWFWLNLILDNFEVQNVLFFFFYKRGLNDSVPPPRSPPFFFSSSSFSQKFILNELNSWKFHEYKQLDYVMLCLSSSLMLLIILLIIAYAWFYLNVKHIQDKKWNEEYTNNCISSVIFFFFS